MRRLSSAIGWLAALALLAGQLSSAVHLLVVQHQRCLEHGELVHAAEVAPSPVPADGAAVTPVEQPEGHGHDHCLCLIHRREAAAPTAADGLAAALMGESIVDDAPPQAASFPIFRLAPKTSPPSADS